MKNKTEKRRQEEEEKEQNILIMMMWYVMVSARICRRPSCTPKTHVFNSITRAEKNNDPHEAEISRVLRLSQSKVSYFFFWES